MSEGGRKLKENPKSGLIWTKPLLQHEQADMSGRDAICGIEAAINIQLKQGRCLWYFTLLFMKHEVVTVTKAFNL